MTILADAQTFPVGVDTDAPNRSRAALAAAATGEVMAAEQFPAAPAGMARTVAWAARHTGGDLGALWVTEGAASYGVRLARTVTDAGYGVVEAADIRQL